MTKEQFLRDHCQRYYNKQRLASGKRTNFHKNFAHEQFHTCLKALILSYFFFLFFSIIFLHTHLFSLCTLVSDIQLDLKFFLFPSGHSFLFSSFFNAHFFYNVFERYLFVHFSSKSRSL